VLLARSGEYAEAGSHYLEARLGYAEPPKRCYNLSRIRYFFIPQHNKPCARTCEQNCKAKSCLLDTVEINSSISNSVQ